MKRVLMIGGWLLGASLLGAQQSAMVGYAPAHAIAEHAAEVRVIARPSGVSASAHSRALSREPHMAGTPAQARTRDYVLAQMRRWGLETEVRAYEVYIPQPRAVHVWLLADSATRDSTDLPLAEGPLPGDTTSNTYAQVPTFNAYSAVGTGAGDVVYVNYGLIEDYAHLDSVGISVAGKVAIARYGRSFRGIKAREAERRGAAALIIYSDPADDGYVRGDVYPDGPMRPEQGVQRGSVQEANGDPSTPGYASNAGVPRVSPADMPLPHIPIVPLSYRNATVLLRDLRGTGSGQGSAAAGLARSAAPLPQTWQGGLPFRYHIGPGPTRARVSFSADTGQAGYHTIWDTFGIVRGSTRPEERVLIGAHRDAWGPGAADNVSGVVSVLEAAHAVADELHAGHRPVRTIVFATWDAEEWGLEGSTEYVEDDSLRLAQHAVAYVNQDISAEGPNFAATGSPPLRALLRDVTRLVPEPSPDTSATVYAGWRRSAGVTGDTAEPPVASPGGGSDFAGFANHLGIPILEWGFDGLQGIYHSAYDDYSWESRFGDPGFRRQAASASIAAAVVLRLANADVLPYDYGEEARTLRAEVAPLDSAMRVRGWSVSTAPLTTAIGRMGQAAAAFAAARDRALGSDAGTEARAAGSAGARLSRSSIHEANRELMRVERALTRPEGLRTRPWFRSLTYASDQDNGYADIALPSVAEAVRGGDQALAARELADLASRFDAAAAALRNASRALVPDR